MMTIERKIQEITNSIRQMDLDFISKDTEGLIGESVSGAERIKKIVCILCNFTHPSVESLENVNIHTGLDGALEILAPQIPSGISVIKNYGNLPLLIANLREINYVFFNLLRNAVQAVALQGTITIDTRVVEDSIEIVIRDTGHGIKKEHLNRIFDPFFTTRTIGSGPGLGLTMAYGIVKNYKGTIKVESREGQGTAITVRLPMNTKPSSHRLN
jgi:signal transduction histidine kinase